MLLDGAINGAGFKTYVERILAPNLRPGDLVVMDNLSSHKVAGVRQAIEQAGAGFDICHRIRPISTRLNWHLPS